VDLLANFAELARLGQTNGEFAASLHELFRR
jgi:hypothetical protein